MSLPIVAIFFVPNKNEQSAQPGMQVTRNVILTGVKPPNSAVPGPNDALFEVPSNGNAQLTIQGASAGLSADFKTGVKYRVTIEEVVDVVAQAAAPAAASESPGTG